MTPFARAVLRWGGADHPDNAVPAAELAKAGYTAKDPRGRTVLTEAGADKWRALASSEGWDSAGSDPIEEERKDAKALLTSLLCGDDRPARARLLRASRCSGDGELLEDLGLVIRVGQIEHGVSGSHMLRHRKRRLRKKWRKRLAMAIRFEFVRHTLARIQSSMDAMG